MLENLSWEQITAWAMMIGGPALSFAGAMLVSKLRKKQQRLWCVINKLMHKATKLLHLLIK